MSVCRPKSALPPLLSLLLLLAQLSAQEIPSENPSLPAPDILSLGSEQCRLGPILVDGRTRTLKMPAKVNMQKGFVELLACTPKGKTHESVLVSDVDPLYFQLALLLLGLEPGANPSSPDTARSRIGDMIEIRVHWKTSAGQPVCHCAEDLLLDVKKNACMERTPWVFLGSRTHDGQFLGRFAGSLITTYHDPLSIVDNPLPSCNDDTVYKANPNVVPPAGTPVTLIISPAPLGEEERK